MEKKEDKKALKIVGTVLLVILRIFLFICFLIPLYLTFVSLLGVTIAYICIMIDGIRYFAPLCAIISIDLFVFFFTYLITKLVIDGNVKVRPLIISFSLFLIFGITSCCLVPYEVLRTKIVDEVPVDYQYVKTTTKINNKYLINTGDYYVNYVVDKKAKKTYTVDIEQSKGIDEFKVINLNKGEYILVKEEMNDYEHLQKLVNNVYTDLKNKEIHDYRNIFDPKITITGNKKTIEKIKNYNYVKRHGQTIDN